MHVYEARVYRIENTSGAFPRASSFNPSGQGTAHGTHILFLTEPANSRNDFGKELEAEQDSDQRIRGILAERAISSNVKLSRAYRGQVSSIATLEGLSLHVKTNYKAATGRTDGAPKQYWEALLLDEKQSDFYDLMKNLQLAE